jgi:hypothetical protein
LTKGAERGAEVYALSILRRMGVLKLRQSWITPTPEDIFSSRPGKKHTSIDNIVGSVALMINL